ncbi:MULTISPECIES: YggS family pyridoxal phosphate-dependent enzyme [unclassified Bacillus (in: firmicutes)]|uniref:YggS family pyridoxal phosphate-dependent enzyme n=1 Tax=unclassified Bacillus (in: firmicutes) TaxID=185979 RepID=UPI001BE8EBCB|nr:MULTISPECIES: YggS family pyridoxal phosphate-dependent enzyme [unclassified Bacillus (in: firmicutes)]MBT2615578.1 YggS family pyridoxal phosphate-dependent enzyme [Bacillus sp. ISL-78]MBT2628715.1 YggS family pyridoxal phosphate-dependent enzyme [Bacillus sp. ISL-101]MBT2715204.1 YggS family pyridoxal phosphate-dependent enzyme [Bacillus sp. ISL-57]
MKVVDNLKNIEEKINIACENSGRDREAIKLIAVTKYVSVERANEALEAGILDLGENRDEGLLAKYEVLKDKPNWHYIGSMQTRKVKNVIDKISYIHSLDRISLAEEIQKRANEPINCLVQVNVSGEESKHGLNPEATIDFIKGLSAFDKVNVAGLMTMAPLTDDERILRECFRKLKGIQVEVQALELEHAPCTELSMGMSNDFMIAIEEGATMIRIGTALVGE